MVALITRCMMVKESVFKHDDRDVRIFPTLCDRDFPQSAVKGACVSN
jgi:hypothetical protein